MFGIDPGEALIEYRPVLGFDPLPSEFIYVQENADYLVERQEFALGGVFGAFDPTFPLPEFKREELPTRVIADGSGGLLLSFQRFHNADGVRTGGVIRLDETNGLRDESFDFGPQLFSTAASVVQPDGKYWFRGRWAVREHPADSEFDQILRVFPDGSPDPSFVSLPFTGGEVLMLTILPDGKILAGGLFTEVDGVPAGGFARLNEDGSLDESFPLPLLDELPNGLFSTGIVAPIVLDGSGKILIGGSFEAVDGSPREGFARLNADGTLDTVYPADGFAIFNGRPVRGIGIEGDGKVVIGGVFTVNSVDNIGLVRLDLNENQDTVFNSVDNTTSGLGSQIRKLVVLGDDKIVAAGDTIARFNADGSLDGTLDTNFTPPSFEEELYPEGHVAQSDGRVIVGGNFTTVNNVPMEGLARFGAGGVLDNTFLELSGFDAVTVERDVSTDNFPDGPVTGIWAVEPEILLQLGSGKLLAVVPGPRPTINLVRLNADGTVDNTFAAGEIFVDEGGVFFSFLQGPPSWE